MWNKAAEDEEIGSHVARIYTTGLMGEACSIVRVLGYNELDSGSGRIQAGPSTGLRHTQHKLATGIKAIRTVHSSG